MNRGATAADAGPLDAARLEAGVRELAAVDPDLAGIAERHGTPPLWSREPGFETLVRIILEQQVSLASAGSGPRAVGGRSRRGRTRPRSSRPGRMACARPG